MDELDAKVRLAAFETLTALVAAYGEAVPLTALQKGFLFHGESIPMLFPQRGIFKPKILRIPLSISTAPVIEGKERPYEDEHTKDGLILYRYQGTDPKHRDNVGVRMAMRERVPLIYFFGVDRGLYAPQWPTFIVGDDPARLYFTAVVDAQRGLRPEEWRVADVGTNAVRAYVTRAVQMRLHQRAFRERVMRAYHERCAICRLRHPELLEAAHILPDGHPRGEPVVPNGIALCKLHHAAFDGSVIGIRPDLVVEVRQEILDEEDGPMLQHGLKEIHAKEIVVPKRPELRPAKENLEERYALFRKTA